ncbi:hypothetical protein [Chitinilyticum aquatile]|uniref:hypothetical protein n=1 Tax=Chitinilyticum aquatile TaxID=362520 RepID=UPI00049150ED|nr:hypothetical protein [Chitinilyticum aquatile]
MHIQLSTAQIDAALPKIEAGLKQYLWLQARVSIDPFFEDVEFRRRYNHFYRVRRGPAWQNTFYSLMAQAKREQLQFQEVLDLLLEATGRYEASFASKLIATLQTSKPVIDSVVLKNLGLRLPSPNVLDRGPKICKLHAELEHMFASYLQTSTGKYLVQEFNRAYPNTGTSDEKKLDLVLWQTRT